jgi:hypothetical protein
MDAAVAFTVSDLGVPLDEALRIASRYPAMFLNLAGRGPIAAGYRRTWCILMRNWRLRRCGLPGNRSSEMLSHRSSRMITAYHPPGGAEKHRTHRLTCFVPAPARRGPSRHFLGGDCFCERFAAIPLCDDPMPVFERRCHQGLCKPSS